MKSIKDVNLQGKTVLLRSDFNVPLDNGVIKDNLRIASEIPTIRLLLEKGAKVIACSHLGRPKGEAKPEFSLRPVAAELEKLLDTQVVFADDDEVCGEKTQKLVDTFKASDRKVMLLQNTRYQKAEEKNDSAFAKKLASFADVFVLDAFGTAHRAHASTVGVADYLPAYGGLLMEKEIKYLDELLKEPKRPFTVIMGGAKVSDKIGIIENLLDKADNFIIGGAMAFTFLKAKGFNVGKSRVEEDKLDVAMGALEKAEKKNVKFYLPMDFTGSTEFSNETEKLYCEIGAFTDDFMGLDIGEKTIREFTDVIRQSSTVVFNGPMGVFEMSNYEEGTRAIIDAMASIDGVSVASGGDSASSVKQFGYSDKVTHVSTGGGASLELLEGKILPGVRILM